MRRRIENLAIASVCLIIGACSSNNGGVDQGGGIGGAGNLGGNSSGAGTSNSNQGGDQSQGGVSGAVGGNGTSTGTAQVGGTGGSPSTNTSVVNLPCDDTACSVAGADCGSVVDKCGGVHDCGTCTQGTCGLTTPNKCSTCVPQTCPAGANCGLFPDGCGNTLDCSNGNTCASPNVCIKNICTGPGAGDAGACDNFCKQQSTTCSTTTTVSGTVLAPNGTMPLPNAVVYVPNGSTTAPYGVTPFVDGVADGACKCDVSGNPLVNTTSNVDGTFTLQNVPVGTNIPLVIQLGRWRRLITIPQVTECQNTQLPASLTSLPTKQNMGNNGNIDAIPLMALTTGSVDALECVLRKMGIDDSQFTNASQNTGRIRFYRDNGARCTTGGGACTGTTPSYSGNTGLTTQAAVDQYDALIFPCDGSAHDVAANVKNLVLDAATSTTAYVNKGGRAFFTHFSYAWLYNQQPSINLPWRSTTSSAAVDNPSNTTHHDPATAVQIDETFARGQVFAQWLGLTPVGALTNITPPEISVTESRWNMNNLSTWDNSGPAQRWAFYPNDTPNAAIMHVTFDTPWGIDPSKQCGRVLYSDFHVTTAALAGSSCTNNGQSTGNCSFPAECSATFTAQEKVLAYMMFDMTSCVQPPDLQCHPLTCADYPNACGPQSDGCGKILDCPACKCNPITCEQACGNDASGNPLCKSTADTVYAVDCPRSTGCQNPPTQQCWCPIG